MAKKKIDRVIDELFAVINKNYSTAGDEYDCITAVGAVLVSVIEQSQGADAVKPVVTVLTDVQANAGRAGEEQALQVNKNGGTVEATAEPKPVTVIMADLAAWLRQAREEA
jgi:hypothetical protein